MKCNATFEGGGVRGIGHVGAAYAMELAGYKFVRLAGSSAGAIVASLLAAEYTAREIKEEMKTLDYLKFKQKDALDRLGTIGRILSIIFSFGIYNADYFEQWLNELLLRKGKQTFGDIKLDTHIYKDYIKSNYKLHITASDLTDNRLLILPEDLKNFGIDPDTFSICKAVRMSMSIPIFYEPYKLKDKDGKTHYIVDGGLLSNYPIWILDNGAKSPPFPTFGFKFIEDEDEKTCKNGICHKKMNIVEYIKSIVSTALDSFDNQHISTLHGDFERTIIIPTTVFTDEDKKSISSTDFSISKIESEALFNNGINSAVNFLENWNFDKWKKAYRN